MNRTRTDIIKQAIKECLNDLYKEATPSITYDNLIKNGKLGLYEKVPAYMQHYLSQEEQKNILDHYIYLYKLNDNWEEYSDLIYSYLEKGGHRVVYNEKCRKDYENTPPLSEIIGEGATIKVLELLDSCKNFYKGNAELNDFLFNVTNYSPCTNIDTVKNFWKPKGILINKTVDDVE